MEYLPNGFTLEVPPGTFPLSTDSVVLARFAKLPKKAKVLDLGSGCGTLGLLLCASDASCHVTGVEQDPAAHEAALRNICRNNLTARMESICADLGKLSAEIPAGTFSVCISNPPYFSGGPVSRRLPNARQETCCTLSDLMQCAARALQYGGDFFLVHKPDRLAQIISLAAGRNLEAKHLCLLRHREDGPIILILLQLRKGGKPGLKMDEAALFDRNGKPTDFYNSVYHLD